MYQIVDTSFFRVDISFLGDYFESEGVHTINDVEWNQQHMIIYLLKFSFENFTKTATIRINLKAGHMVRPMQTTFMQGRNILDELVVLHEMVHEMHQKI
jgi:hypothetical protein